MIWDHKINPFLDSPKKMHPYSCIFFILKTYYIPCSQLLHVLKMVSSLKLQSTPVTMDTPGTAS